MDTQTEVERIRALWATYASGGEWLDRPGELQALGAEVGTLLAIIERHQAVIQAAWKVDASLYLDEKMLWAARRLVELVSPDQLGSTPYFLALHDALDALKGAGDA